MIASREMASTAAALKASSLRRASTMPGCAGAWAGSELKYM
eukprot:CAMPEP_0115130424 /NCGR_PEP_ID=MMETSP0227-20121206/52464_1 /TAXON_ID=89957 /ORGANISM="Polarella glacialis, Strain CCMP 1383" /LENGTH=40 /DNA_ID= /DNA_START= /DNA_END= /DNA_ORIENTATION=